MTSILLIDDDEDDQLLFKEAIKCIYPKLVCDTAANGKIALDKLKQCSSLPDLIFVDLNMPIMNGIDFLIQIKKEKLLQNIPVGIFSTSNIDNDKLNAKELGAKFFLTKPSAFKELCTQLQQLLTTDFVG